jgi:chromosome partitioning protein
MKPALYKRGTVPPPWIYKVLSMEQGRRCRRDRLGVRESVSGPLTHGAAAAFDSPSMHSAVGVKIKELGRVSPMKVKEKVTVIVFVNNKGGVGKTRHAILTADCLAKAGYSVLVIDMDFNNSSTYFYLADEMMRMSRNKNIKAALSDEGNYLCDFTLGTIREGVDIIASSRDLSDLRAINEKRLKNMMPALSGSYDFVVIDSQPSYDNLTLNAINAGDVIITPVLKDFDSFNAAAFLRRKLEVETDKLSDWYVTINGYNRRYEEASGGRQKEYIEEFQKAFPMTPKETWYPWTADMNELKDLRKKLSREPEAGAVCNPALYDAVVNLTECFLDEGEELVCGGAF